MLQALPGVPATDFIEDHDVQPTTAREGGAKKSAGIFGNSRLACRIHPARLDLVQGRALGEAVASGNRRVLAAA
jgi:hypothetical protein